MDHGNHRLQPEREEILFTDLENHDFCRRYLRASRKGRIWVELINYRNFFVLFSQVSVISTVDLASQTQYTVSAQTLNYRIQKKAYSFQGTLWVSQSPCGVHIFIRPRKSVLVNIF
jgi:hypothetical protein